MTEAQRTRLLVALEMVQEVILGRGEGDYNQRERAELGKADAALREALVKPRRKPIVYRDELVPERDHVWPMPPVVNATERERTDTFRRTRADVYHALA